MRNNKKALYFIKCIVFIIILLLLIESILFILKKPKNKQWDASGLQYVHENPNFYDVIFCGTSIAIMNVSNEELYSQFGIAAVTLGEPEQPTYLSYYTLKDALKVQSPQVVFYDINAMFYTEDMLIDRLNKDEYYYLHLSVDGIKDYKLKLEAIQTAKQLKPEIDIMSYFSSLYNNHSNWEEVGESNFVRNSGDLVMNGNLMSFDIADGLPLLRSNYNTNYDPSVSTGKLIEFNKEYLIKIIELCKENDVELVLLRGAGVNTYLTNANFNAISQLAEENEVSFIDISQCEEAVGIDWRVDSTDGNHHNIMGAKKWTDYLGNYLVNNYKFTDRREDPEYDYFKKELPRYQEALEIMQTKINLLSATDFIQYLDILKLVNTNENTVFIAVNDDATEQLSEKECEKLSELGLTNNLQGKFRYSYAAVIDNDQIEELLGEKQVAIDGNLDNKKSYSIKSGGYLSGISASILIDGQEIIQGGRGFNVVVYNKKYGEVLSNVYFDTFLNANPPTSRKTKLVQKQYEVDVNQWMELE